MTAGPKCYVCGSRELAADADLRSPTCEDCKEARRHVVSMQTAPGGGSLAVCPCGWRSKVAGRARYTIQNVKVRLHWRDAIKRSRTLRSVSAFCAELSAEFGVTRRELIRDALFGVAAVAVIFLDLVVIAAITKGAVQ